MSDTTLVGTYRRYKAGTTKLVTWLAESAQRTLPPAANAKVTANPATAPKNVTTEELLNFAQRIVKSSKPKIVIEQDILNVAYDVIPGRRECARWYAALADEQDATLGASNESHMHFINVLQQIYDLLKSEYKARLPKRLRKDDAALEATIKDVSNIFSVLELQDTSDEAKSAVKNAESKPKKAPNPAKKQTYELRNADEEKRFAIWCLLKDLQETCLYLRGVWQRYARGQATSVLAGRLMEVALCICDERIQEFLDLYPESHDFEEILQFIGASFGECHQLRGQTSHQQRQEVHGTRLDIEQRPDDSDLLCASAWHALDGFREYALHLQNDTTPVEDQKRAACGDPFCAALLQATPLLYHMLPSHKEPYSNLAEKLTRLDTLIGGLVRLPDPGIMDIHLVSDAQMCWHINDVLQGALVDVFDHAESAISALHARCDRFMAYFDGAAPSVRQHVLHVTFQKLPELRESVQRIEKDGKTVAWQVAHFQGGGFQEPLEMSVPLMTLFPLLSMHVMSMTKSYVAIAEAKLCSFEQTMQAVAFLYKAARVSGILQNEWQDMEYVIARQNTKTNFCRKTQNNVRSVTKALVLAMGVKAESFGSSRRRHDRNAMSFVNLVEMSTCSPFDDALAAEQRLSRGVGSERVGFMRVLHDCARLHLGSKAMQKSAVAQQYAKTKMLSVAQLLAIFCHSFAQDEVQRNFDHLKMLARILRMMEAVTSACASRLNATFTNTSLDALPYSAVVIEILGEASVREERGIDMHETMLWQASQIMSAEIDRFGDECKSEAIAKSSMEIGLDVLLAS